MRVLLLCLALLWAGPAAATQEYVLPTLFEVTGVETDDVLNIRTAPNASAEIIGTFGPDAGNIEVVAQDPTGRWAQVNTAERNGWVALRYLAYQTGVWNDGQLPASLHCLGTEPFWTLRPEKNSVVFSTPDARDRGLTLKAVLGSGVFRDPHRALVADETDKRLTAVIMPKACSDGMSDRVYGLEINIVLEDRDATELLIGCCSIAP